ncbi:MAG: IS630 family transposase, partial [Cyanobacteria bacterium J06635_11]
LPPAEHLWPLTNEATVNQYFETIEAVEEAIYHRGQERLQCPDLIRGLTQLHWWPIIAPP